MTFAGSIRAGIARHKGKNRDGEGRRDGPATTFRLLAHALIFSARVDWPVSIRHHALPRFELGAYMRIGKIGVIGAGAMGSGIAALAASAGFPVVLLDVPGESDKNAPARNGVQRALKGRPPQFMAPERAALVA